MKTFCMSCGRENIYFGREPKFCGHCGSDINASATKQNKVQKNVKVKPLNAEESFNEEKYRDLIANGLFQYEIPNRSETLDYKNAKI